jgi:hypothetical protein
MKHESLSEEQFAIVTKISRMEPASLDVARKVLVLGQRQSEVAKEIGRSRQWVNEIIKKVRVYADKAALIPPGWKSGTVILPNSDWPKVRDLERKARKALSSGANKKKTR